MGIPTDRISNLNIGFEFGTLHGKAVEVTKLTKNEYDQVLKINKKVNKNLHSASSSDFKKPQEISDDFAMKYPGVSKSSDENKKLSRRNVDPFHLSKNNDTDALMPPKSKRQIFDFNSKRNTDDSTSMAYSQEVSKRKQETIYRQSFSEATVIRKIRSIQENVEESFSQGVCSTRKTKCNSHNEMTNKKGNAYNENNGGVWRNVEVPIDFIDAIRSAEKMEPRPMGLKNHSNGFIIGEDSPKTIRSIPNLASDTSFRQEFMFEPFNQMNNLPVLLRSSIKNLVHLPITTKVSFVFVPSKKEPNVKKSKVLESQLAQMVMTKNLNIPLSGRNIPVIKSINHEKYNFSETDEEFCNWGQKYKVDSDEFVFLTVKNESYLYVNKTNSYNRIGQFDFWISVKGNNMAAGHGHNITLYNRFAYVCRNPTIRQKDCRRIHLTGNEYEIIKRNKSIIFEEKEYDIYSYEVVNKSSGSVAICVPISYDEYKVNGSNATKGGCSSKFFDVLKADGYLTLFLGRLSVFTLFLVLVTYCLFKSLRNLPGQNTMNLTIALIIAQVVLTEGMVSSKSWLCAAIAITEHFSRLAAHFWMNVISYDTYQTFSNPTFATQFHNKRYTFLKYNLYAWGVPLVIVALCVFIDFSGLFADVNIGYGVTFGSSKFQEMHENRSPEIDINRLTNMYSMGNSINESEFTNSTPFDKMENKQIMVSGCWISNPLASLIVFGAPIFIILVINIVFFVRTIMHISRTSKASKTDLSKQASDNSISNAHTKRSDLTLYIRMSTVIGVTWIFGFIWSITKSFAEVQSQTICIIILSQGIISTTFNVSQGIFIFMAFVCNRRVMSLYAKLWARARKQLIPKRTNSRLYSVSSSLILTKQMHANDASLISIRHSTK